MPTYNTSLLRQDGTFEGQNAPIDKFTSDQIYNSLDCCLTSEIFEEVTKIHEISEEIWKPTYEFEKALQAPYLSIMRKGFLVDERGRKIAAEELRGRIAKLQETLNTLSNAVWDKNLNPNSSAQLKDFFYNAMSLPEIKLSFKGVKKVSVNREALEKLDEYLYARPFVSIILLIRDLKKQLEVFENNIDTDGRFRASYNIAGTETGRPSSSESAFETGRNAQNIAPNLRFVFIADINYRMCVIDLEQVEARDVGYFAGCLFNDWGFLNACESGDLHTNNAKRIWPELEWTEDRKQDKIIAERNFYREFSYRDMAKRGSHLSNYMGTAWTAARSLKVPLNLMEDFQARYCKGGRGFEPAYPVIPKWWQWTGEQLQRNRELTTPFGRRRHFFGRPSDDTTLREAIAFLPQSTTADRMNLGLWRIWKYIPEVQLLAQTHDSVTFQYSDTLNEQLLIPKILKLIQVELFGPNGRSYIVPGEAKVGWNWGNRVTHEDQEKASKDKKRIPRLNLDGLIKFNPDKPDTRQRTKKFDILSMDLDDL